MFPILRRSLRAPVLSLPAWRPAPLHIQQPVWSIVSCLYTSDSGQKKEKIAVELRDEDLVESFVKGWGKGGQKINKVRNCVLLKHVPTGLHVRCQETRSLDGNRRIARRLLLQKLDDHVNGELSKRNLKILKLRKKKANRRSKSKQKYAGKASDDDDAGEEEDDEEDEEGDDEDYDEGDDLSDDEDNAEVVEFDVEEHKFRSKKK